MFLRLKAPTTNWYVKQAMVGELISVLYGSCVDVEKATLDPPPKILGEEMSRLVSLGWQHFLRGLLSRRKFSREIPFNSPDETTRERSPSLIMSWAFGQSRQMVLIRAGSN